MNATDMHSVRIFAFADEASPQLEGQIRAMTRNGLEGLEIRGVDGANVSDIPLEKARQVRSRLADAGLSVWAVGSPIGKIDLEKDDFAVHMDKLRHTLDVARELGAKNLRMFSFYIPAGRTAQSCRQQVIDWTGEMLSAGRGSGITFCHENEKGIYGDVAARARSCLICSRRWPAYSIRRILCSAGRIRGRHGRFWLPAFGICTSRMRFPMDGWFPPDAAWAM